MLDTSLAASPTWSALPPERLVFGSDRPYGEHATALRLVALAARARRLERRSGGGRHGRQPAAVAAVTGDEAVRLSAALAQCEIALVRRDAVASALLAQAARHADGLAVGELVGTAAAHGAGARSGRRPPDQDAARKVVQALCRAAVCEVDAALLRKG